MKPFKELCFTDDFMFCKVMQDPTICKDVLELILRIRIRKIEYSESQKTLTGAFDTHGIRLDVYTEDDENRIFDVEMQTYQDDLPRRSRFYNGMIDRKLLKPGGNYKDLKECFIIFISTKQVFDGYNKCIYQFENRCKNDPDLILNDGVHKIFVTPDGDDSALPNDVREFLLYLRDPAKAVSRNKLLDSIETAVSENRLNAQMEEEYMYLEDYGRQQREIGSAEGKLELLFSLVQDGDLSTEIAAAKVGLTQKEFEDRMTAAGYRIPASV